MCHTVSFCYNKERIYNAGFEGKGNASIIQKRKGNACMMQSAFCISSGPKHTLLWSPCTLDDFPSNWDTTRGWRRTIIQVIDRSRGITLFSIKQRPSFPPNPSRFATHLYITVLGLIQSPRRSVHILHWGFLSNAAPLPHGEPKDIAVRHPSNQKTKKHVKRHFSSASPPSSRLRQCRALVCPKSKSFWSASRLAEFPLVI